MRVDIISIFPDFFAPLDLSLIVSDAPAVAAGVCRVVEAVNREDQHDPAVDLHALQPRLGVAFLGGQLVDRVHRVEHRVRELDGLELAVGKDLANLALEARRPLLAAAPGRGKRR